MKNISPVELILGIAALLIALGVIGKALRRGAKVVALIEDAAPTVLSIAKQFEDSRGADIRQKLDLAVETAAEAAELSRQRAELLAEIKGTIDLLSQKQTFHRHKTNGTLTMLTESVSKNMKEIHEISLELARRGVRMDVIETNIAALSDLKELLRGDE